MTRVLVVDDEPQIRRALAINLRTRGYDVDLADSGEQALELAAKQHPDVVVLDLGLPRLRASLRRATHAEEPVIVETPDFSIDLGAKRVTRDGSEVRLTPTEWHLVEVLVRNRGKLVSQRQLLQEVWGPRYGTETNYL